VNIPDWYEIILLSLAAWRIFQLIAFDSILDQPRRYVTRLGKKWEKEGDALPKEYREKWALFLQCPYCLGFWIGLVWWGAWLIWPYETLVAAVPFVISAGVIGADKILSSE
jgi:hypothetical protein